MLKALLLVPVTLVLVACSSAPRPGSPEELAILHEKAAQDVFAITAQAPPWFMKPPQDDSYLYAAGTAVSSDLQFSIDKAILMAKFHLADQSAGTLSAQQKDFLKERSAGNLGSVGDRTIDNLVSATPLPGYQIVEKKVVAVDTQYRSFVLLRFSTVRVAIQSEKAGAPQKPEIDAAAEAAHQELQKELVKPSAPDAKPDQTAKTADQPPSPVAAPRPPVDRSEL